MGDDRRLEGPESPIGRPISTTDGAERLDLDQIALTPAIAAPAAHEPVGEGEGRRSARVGRWGRDLAIGAVLLILAAVLPLFRQGGTPSWRTVWAEDGSIYAQQAIRSGPLSVLFRGYAGYLQLPPRLLIIPATWLSIRDLAWYCAIVSVLVSALLAWFVFHMTRGWISSPVARVVLASFVVLTPSLGPENTACLVNTIWVFAAVVPWALVSLEEGRRDTALRAAVALLAAASTPLCMVYVPVAIGWLLIRRTRSAMVVFAAFVVGLAMQGAVVVSTTHTSDIYVINSLSALRDAIGLRVFGVFLVGPKWAAQLWGVNWLLAAAGSTVVVLVIGALIWVRSDRWAQRLAPVLVVCALAIFILPVWGRGTLLLGMIEGHAAFIMGASRFDVIPVILLGSAFALLISPAGGAPPRRAQRVVLALFAAQVVLLTAVNFRVEFSRSYFSPWEPKVAAVYAQQSAGRPSDTLVTIPNQSVGSLSPAVFPVTVPCSSLAP